MKKTVLILCGGRSAEHEISLISARGILGALDRTRYTPVLIGIAKSGTWHLLPEERYFKGEFRADTITLNTDTPTVTLAPYLDTQGRGILQPSQAPPVSFDVVFPIVHGQYGEDGTLQGMLDLIGIPYVGARCGASWVCMDKVLTKVVCEKNGIPVAPYVSVRRGEDWTKKRAALTALGLPVFVKPSCQGSSIGITKVTESSALGPAIQNALKYDRVCLVEQAIVGRELECAVLGSADHPEASLPGEILISEKAGWYSYEAKYLGGELATTQTPAALPEAITLQIQDLAKRVFSTLECDGMARIDFLLENATGKLYLNEPNTLPGFTPISMYPQMWAASGLPYQALISRLLDFAFERQTREANQ